MYTAPVILFSLRQDISSKMPDWVFDTTLQLLGLRDVRMRYYSSTSLKKKKQIDGDNKLDFVIDVERLCNCRAICTHGLFVLS